ncbi:MAG TPA: hypothetical protein VJ765_02225, partial [Chitinophagaceae bacterium]|nr:hypothetical protein [Chitinophagaceae bacterium]
GGMINNFFKKSFLFTLYSILWIASRIIPKPVADSFMQFFSELFIHNEGCLVNMNRVRFDDAIRQVRQSIDRKVTCTISLVAEEYLIGRMIA